MKISKLTALLCCGALTFVVVPSVSAVAITSGYKKSLSTEELKNFLITDVGIEEGIVITDDQMKNFSFSNFTDEDWKALSKQWLKIVPKMPNEFFRKFHGTNSYCIASIVCAEIFRVNIAGTQKNLKIPVDASAMKVDRILMKGGMQGGVEKMVIEIDGKPGDSGMAVSEIPTKGFGSTDDEINAVKKMYEIYFETRKRLEELGSKQKISNSLEDKSVEVEPNFSS